MSDVSDDVRRAAVMSLGFLLFRCVLYCVFKLSQLKRTLCFSIDRIHSLCNTNTKCAGFNIFLICRRTPEQCPSVVSLLSESYNPHVRYGAAMALGIACSGTGLKVSRDNRLHVSLDQLEI